MKKLLSFIFAALSCAVVAQSFEGTIEWTITSEISDPALKAKMEEGQKQMNSPENQARMKEMQERMNDPKMKEMMAANPQMKAQMERAMQMASGGGMNTMIPKKMIIKIKGDHMLSKMEGGMDMEVLTVISKNLTYHLNRANKTYTVIPQTSPTPEDQAPKSKVTKTGETIKILGYTCTKYIVETTMGEHTIKQVYWTTPEIHGLTMKTFANQRMGGNQMYFEGLEGVPMKVEGGTPQMKMVMEMSEITKGSVSDADVSLPADFTEVK